MVMTTVVVSWKIKVAVMITVNHQRIFQAFHLQGNAGLRLSLGIIHKEECHVEVKIPIVIEF